MRDWQPIETAPTDGTQILISWKTKIDFVDPAGSPTCSTARRLKNKWIIGECKRGLIEVKSPTHWQPLPEAPANSARK